MCAARGSLQNRSASHGRDTDSRPTQSPGLPKNGRSRTTANQSSSMARVRPASETAHAAPGGTSAPSSSIFRANLIFIIIVSHSSSPGQPDSVGPSNANGGDVMMWL